MAIPEKRISEKQKKFIRDLVHYRDISGMTVEQREFLSDLSDANLNRMPMSQASKAIKLLLECPKKTVAQPTVPQRLPAQSTTTEEDLEPELKPTGDSNIPVAPVRAVETTRPAQTTELAKSVPEGYFFIVDPTQDKEMFFRVSHGKKDTRWEGYVFLESQASDDFYSVKDSIRREAIFAEIMKDPVKAMNEYGIRLGRCGVCGRTLTARSSRYRGIGPICDQRLGMTNEQAATLRQLGLLKD